MHRYLLFLFMFQLMLLPLYAGGGKERRDNVKDKGINDIDKFINILNEQYSDWLYKHDVAYESMSEDDLGKYSTKMSIIIPKSNLDKAVQGTVAEKWFGEFCEKISQDIEKDFNVNLPDTEKQKLTRYLKYKNYQSENKVDFDTFIGTIRKFKKDKQEELAVEFEKKWSVRPDKPLFDDPSKLSDKLENAKVVAEYYHGKKNGDKAYIQFVIDLYNKIVGVYEKFNRDVSPEIFNILDKNLKITFKELNKIIGEEKNRFNSDTEKYENKIGKLGGEYLEKIKNEFKNVYENVMSSDFDYKNLSVEKNDTLNVLIYKNHTLEQPVKNFREHGLTAEVIGVFDNFIYVCEDGNIVFYDAFSLEEDKSKRIKTKNEKILFVLNPDVHIFITENKNMYEVKKLEKKKSEQYILSLVKPVNKAIKTVSDSPTEIDKANVIDIPATTVDENKPDVETKKEQATDWPVETWEDSVRKSNGGTKK